MVVQQEKERLTLRAKRECHYPALEEESMIWDLGVNQTVDASDMGKPPLGSTYSTVPNNYVNSEVYAISY